MRVFILAIIFLCACAGTNAQIKRAQLTENSIVKDSSGKVYPIDIWEPMLMKGYSLKPVNSKKADTEWIIYKKSDEELELMYKKNKPRGSTSFKKGEKFSSFKATDINGNEIDIKALQGKIIVMNFWFIDCQPCRLEIPELNELADSFKNNNKVVFIAVGLDKKSSIEKFLKIFPFKYSIIENGQSIADQYRIGSYPTNVVVDTEQKVYFHTSGLGATTIYWIRKSIEELLKKEEAKTALK